MASKSKISKKYTYFVNLDNIDKLIKKYNTIIFNIFKNENEKIKYNDPLFKEIIEKYFIQRYFQVNYTSIILDEINKIIECEKFEKYNYILNINGQKYYPLYLIEKYISQEYALQFLEITYIFNPNKYNIDEKENQKNINNIKLIKLEDNKLIEETIYKIFYSTISNMIIKKLFINSTVIKKLCKNWLDIKDIKLTEYLKIEIEKMKSDESIKYIWLNTLVKYLNKSNKNIFIAHILIERLITHKFILLQNNINYFQITNSYKICESNTIKILMLIDKKISYLFKQLFK